MHPGPKDKDMFLIVSHVCAAGFVFFSGSLLVGVVLPLSVPIVCRMRKVWPDFCPCILNSCIFEQFVVQSINCEPAEG